MKGRWLLTGLVISLALNLFLVGLGVGALVFGGGQRGAEAQAAAGPRRAPLWAAGRALSETHRPAYRQALAQATREARPDLLESRRLKRKAFDAMATTPYDAVAVAVTRTRRFARRQQRWFGRDPRITWFDLDRTTDGRDLADAVGELDPGAVENALVAFDEILRD